VLVTPALQPGICLVGETFGLFDVYRHGSKFVFLLWHSRRKICMIHVVLLLGCAVAIYLACEWFVNAVEWLGARMKVGPVAVGTVLAAIGTALPESVVTLVAVAFGGSDDRKDIGVGAAMGGPLALSTVAYAVAGLMVFLVARSTARSSGVSVATARTELMRDVDVPRLARDQVWFLAIFVFKFALGLVAFAIKPWLGVLFFVAYIAFFIKELREEGVAQSDDLEPLKLQPRSTQPSTWAVVTQTVITLVLIYFASQLFVHQLEWVGPEIGIAPTVVALLLSPIATELPEIMNAIIWIRQRKTSLALANISGAMMIQATVPSGIGIIFTSWKFDAPLVLAGAVTIAAVAYLTVLLRSNRMHPLVFAGAGLLYVVFVIGLLFGV
jgi:cation:H+ antiporter